MMIIILKSLAFGIGAVVVLVLILNQLILSYRVKVLERDNRALKLWVEALIISDLNTGTMKEDVPDAEFKVVD